MALTIKNPCTIELAHDLAHRLQTTQTAAITIALRQALDARSDERDARAARVDAILHRIWDDASASDALRVRQNMAAMYDERGLPA